MTLNIITITIMIIITNIILIIIISRYSCQLTFRQKWLDPRLAYSDMEGEVAGQGFLFSKQGTTLFSLRPVEVSNDDGSKQSVDARHFLPGNFNYDLMMYSIFTSTSYKLQVKYFLTLISIQH